MSNETMELLELVLREQEDLDDYIRPVADALGWLWRTGQPEHERGLQEAAREYWRVV